MIFYTFFSRILIFFVLSRVSTASPECSEDFGSGIIANDCVWAYKMFNSRVFHASYGTVAAQTFSKDAKLVGDENLLRQSFVHRTCVIGIDMLPATGTAKTSWNHFHDHILRLLMSCVALPGTIGGVSKFGNFEVVIANPRQEAVRSVLGKSRSLPLPLSESIKTIALGIKMHEDGKASPPSPGYRSRTPIFVHEAPPPHPLPYLGHSMPQTAGHPPVQPNYHLGQGAGHIPAQMHNVAQPLPYTPTQLLQLNQALENTRLGHSSPWIHNFGSPPLPMHLPAHESGLRPPSLPQTAPITGNPLFP